MSKHGAEKNTVVKPVAKPSLDGKTRPPLAPVADAAKMIKGKESVSPSVVHGGLGSVPAKSVRKSAAGAAAAGRALNGAVGGQRRGVGVRSVEVSPASSHDPIQFREEVERLPRTFLNAKQLSEFKDLLLRKRAQLAGDVMHLTDEALHRRVRGAHESSAMPIHMADLGSDNWEQDFTLGLIANEQQVVREIDDALQRIQDRTYGMCVATGKRIGVARLRAKPWARYCIEYARAREEGRTL